MPDPARTQLQERISPYDAIPENATNINASCLWCGWRRPVARGTEVVSHTCFALDIVMSDGFRVSRQPALRLEWTEYRPYVPEEAER